MPRGIGILLAAAASLLAACATRPQSPVDPAIEAELQRIKAIDNHAHPVRVAPIGEPPDRGFDALPVDNLDPQSDPVQLRPGATRLREATRTLFGAMPKQRRIEEMGDRYPAWVLDQMGVDIMLANRVEMGKSVESPRFRWVAYADALMYPLPTAGLALRNSDRKAFFALEDRLLARYLKDLGISEPPPTLDAYLSRVVTPTLERHKRGGAVAEKFEAAYLRSLAFDNVDRAAAARIYARFLGQPATSEADYKPLQDFLFRYIVAECGRLGMAVQVHASAGGGGFFDVQGANPLALEPALDDPALRKTNFVLVHGGWPFTREATALLTKPNVYVDFSGQSLLLGTANLAAILREWLEHVPEKVLFATDGYPYNSELGWEESGWIAARIGRQALGLALTAMVRDAEISREQAIELVRMVMRENARRLYRL
jgi:hypothetical protein